MFGTILDTAQSQSFLCGILSFEKGKKKNRTQDKNYDTFKNVKDTRQNGAQDVTQLTAIFPFRFHSSQASAIQSMESIRISIIL